MSVECPEQTPNRHHLGAQRTRNPNSFNVGVLGEIEREPPTERVGDRLQVSRLGRSLDVPFNSLELRREGAAMAFSCAR
jgi:hypothetical protein